MVTAPPKFQDDGAARQAVRGNPPCLVYCLQPRTLLMLLGLSIRALVARAAVGGLPGFLPTQSLVVHGQEHHRLL